MNIDKLDYHSLIIFESISRHLNAGLVANELGMSISSVSRHLGILRDIFKDVLFIRRAQGFVLSDKAIQLLPYIKQLLHDYQVIKHNHIHFNPLTARGHFNLSGSMAQSQHLAERALGLLQWYRPCLVRL